MAATAAAPLKFLAAAGLTVAGFAAVVGALAGWVGVLAAGVVGLNGF